MDLNQVVVFDIDGTLTPKVSAVGAAREDAARAVLLFYDKGYKIVYLSARTRLLQSIIPGWLVKNGFPEGSIHVPQTSFDSGDHAGFKKRILNEFQENGWNFFAAYGDSSTDFSAYSEAGIDESRIFALQRVDEDSCQPGRWGKCLNSWSEHLDYISQLAQPYKE